MRNKEDIIQSVTSRHKLSNGEKQWLDKAVQESSEKIFVLTPYNRDFYLTKQEHIEKTNGMYHHYIHVKDIDSIRGHLIVHTIKGRYWAMLDKHVLVGVKTRTL